MNKTSNSKTFQDFSRASWNTNLSSTRQASIQAWLEGKGMTRRDLAMALGVDPSLLTLIFSGRRRVTQERRSSLEALGFPLELVDGIYEPKRKGAQP